MEPDFSFQFGNTRRKKYLSRLWSPFPKRELQAQMASLVNSAKHLRKNNTNSTHTLPENRRGGNGSQPIL